jgi:hypothetical protein
VRSLRLLCLGVMMLAGLTLPVVPGTATAGKAKTLGTVKYIDRGLAVRPPHRGMHKGKVKEPLYGQYFLRTARKQRASVRFRDGTALHINQMTDLTLASPNVTTVQRGEVAEVLVPGTNHQVQTGSAIATAIGTEFDVKVSGKRTVFIVVHGKLKVSNHRGTVYVTGNHESAVQRGKAPGKPVKVDAAAAVAWTAGIPVSHIADNVALDANGGKVSGASSEKASGNAHAINDGRLDTAWETAAGKTSGQWVKVSLPAGKTFTLSEVLIDPSAPRGAPASEALRDFDIRVSTTGNADSDFQTVFHGTAQQESRLQRFTLPPNTQAKYVELVADSNYGNASRTAVTELEVVGTEYVAPIFADAGIAGEAMDPQGNLYVADGGKERILKISPQGKLLLSFGSPGQGPGKFSELLDVALDSQGNIYALSQGNADVQKFSPDGKFLADFTNFGDGFINPFGLDVDSAGNIYVAVDYTDQIVKVSPTDQVLAVYGGGGTDPGKFTYLQDVTLDSQGNMYTVEGAGQNARIQKLAPDGTPLGQWGQSELQWPRRIEVDRQGNMIVSDSGVNKVFKYSASGALIWAIGGAGSGPGQFNNPAGLAVDSQGNIYVGDAYNHRVQKFSPDGKLLAIWK